MQWFIIYMQKELEGLQLKFGTAAASLADLFRVVIKAQGELYEKGKSDAFFELMQACQQRTNEDGRIDIASVKAFAEEKLKEIESKSN